MSESTHQKALIRWFRVSYPELQKNLFAIPNGANFSAARPEHRYGQVAKLKAEGMQPGVPDLFLALPWGGFAGLFIEMKDEGKTLCSLSNDQKTYLELLQAAGYCAIWASGFDIARAAVDTYLQGYTKQTIH